ncbi:AAA family ATPase [Lentzea sp.]|uniref:AAA family ATPase n=1 Tax=Lentzea sp. TaxID=56099 RepID=UPI002BC0B6C4|nr:AAA family ATPase [Lentzea sp.]HUQ56785.1 AAA family ATPase [Lentzea sp.]
MADRELKSIGIDGFTSIRSASVTLGRINVLVGPNGAGKSNFIRVFELLGRIVDDELNLFVGLNGGANTLRNSAMGHVTVAVHGDTSYKATLVPAARDELIFESEWIGHLNRGQEIGRGHRETRLHEYVPVPEGEDSIAEPVVDLLRGCRVFHFHDTSANAPVKSLVSTADNLSLRNDAGNVAAVLLALREADHPAYRRIVRTIRLVAPFFRDFVLEPERNDLIRLRWRQNESDLVFSANQMSDGTLRFICLVTLLLHPRLPSLVVLDEPELGLHPCAIVQLASLLRQAAMRSQVLIATQSVTLMNQFALDELIVVERQNGASEFGRRDPAQLQDWLAEYSLGELWEKNVLGGRPSGNS